MESNKINIGIFFSVVLLFMFSIILPVTSAEKPNLHINLKEDFEFYPETKSDPEAQSESIYVEAEYSEDPIFGRSNKQYVNIGTWTANARDFIMNCSLKENSYFNIWYQIHQEGYGAEPRFSYEILYKNETSEYRFTKGVDGEDPDDDAIIEVIDFYTWDFANDIAPEDRFEITINYSGYEDCSIYFDNITYDSGLSIESDFLHFIGGQIKDDTVTLEVVDAFHSNWNEVMNFIMIKANDTFIKPQDVTRREGTITEIYGENVTSTIIECKIENSQSHNDVVVWIKYIDAKENENIGLMQSIEIGNEKDDNGNGVKKDNDEEFISGFEAMIVSIAIIISSQIIRNRKREI